MTKAKTALASPTIKAIAQRVGISYSTVSRALNDKRGVRSDLRETIKRIAGDLGYLPNSSAKALVKKRIGVLGLIIPRTGEFAFQSPYYSQMLLGISEIANQHDYNLTLSINAKGSYASLYFRRLVDGIIVIGNRIDDENIAELENKGVPAVVVPGFLENSGIDVPSANSENVRCVYRAVNYLLDLGHRKIAFILGTSNSKYSVERFKAYQAAFRDRGLIYNSDYIVESDFSKTDGFRLMGRLLDLPERPTCVICINDTVTPGALHQINLRGLKIPEDISFVAIGSSDILDLFQPPLTTVKIAVTKIGQTVAQMLIQLIENGSCPERHVVIPSELIIRDSTCAVKGQKQV
ncbi:MAG: LacI family DNA-binding transcriptional regulator [Deltaproteobacteria bacterium]|nr:LacI family DNA-binding transcriptional regulator [Deltaproteobacteria bacterium]